MIPTYKTQPPGEVNEVAVRLSAGFNAALLGVALFAGLRALVVVAAAGFVVRALAGPRLSLLSRVSEALAGRLGAPLWVPGRPKRFAQLIGAVFTVGASAALYLGLPWLGNGLAGVVVGCAFLESALGFCLGCWMFAWLERWGVVRAQTQAA